MTEPGDSCRGASSTLLLLLPLLPDPQSEHVLHWRPITTLLWGLKKRKKGVCGEAELHHGAFAILMTGSVSI